MTDGTTIACPRCGEQRRVIVTSSNTFRKKRHEWSMCVACWIKEERE